MKSMAKVLMVLALVAVICLPGMAFAATTIGLPDLTVDWSQEFQNDLANTNAIYFWMNTASPQTTFQSVTFGGGHSSWQTYALDTMHTSMYGPKVAANTGGIYVAFSYPSSNAMSFQWAEVEWSGGSSTILGSGTGKWSGSSWDFNDTTFTHGSDIYAVPPHSTALLLGSGLLGLGLLRLRKRTKA